MIRVTLVVALALAMTISGVFATWRYTLEFTEDKFVDVSLSVLAFDYPPEEVLPDDEEADELGQNHLDLIQKLLNERSYGLNATKKPILHELLNQAGDVVCCEQNVQGGNLKHLMIDGTAAYSLLFQLEYVSDTEYIAYTYLASDAKSYPVGEEIEVYKTIMSRGESGVWTAPVSYEGVASVSRANVSSSIRCIESSTWRDA